MSYLIRSPNAQLNTHPVGVVVKGLGALGALELGPGALGLVDPLQVGQKVLLQQEFLKNRVGGGGGLAVRVLAFYSDDPGSNHAD